VRMRARENLLDVRISRAFAHLPHRKGHRWRRKRHSGSGEESVIRLFMSHSLTVLRRANIHGDSVGDGREESLESTPAGIARPAKMTVFGAHRAPPQKLVGLMFFSPPFDNFTAKTTPSVRMRARENLLDVRISRSFAHLPHRKGHRWGRRRHPGPCRNPSFVYSCPIR